MQKWRYPVLLIKVNVYYIWICWCFELGTMHTRCCFVFLNSICITDLRPELLNKCFVSVIVIVLSSLSLSLGLVMRKPVYAIFEQKRRRSACASVQSDQHLYCSLPGQYITSTCHSRNFKPLASPCGWAGRFVSFLDETPEDRFSRAGAHCILKNHKK